MDGQQGDFFDKALNNHANWLDSFKKNHSDLLAKLGEGQSPQILWIGCSDSRCPETTILGLQPGDVFVHRNIANILVSTDLSSNAVIQFAVQYLKVKHIVLSGHTSCGGIAAALDNKKLGLIDAWLMPLRSLRQQNLAELEKLSPKEASLKLVELNVKNGIRVLRENPVVIDAKIERGLKLHGVIYNVATGRLEEVDIAEDDGSTESRIAAFKLA